jgi:hypothetical protein
MRIDVSAGCLVDMWQAFLGAHDADKPKLRIPL